VTRVLRVLAPNPGVYTLEGTNTWIVGREPSIVIDPGPDDSVHIDEVRRSAGRVAAIVVTHDHDDHAPGARRLAEATGAPIHAFRPFDGALAIRDGAEIAAERATVTAHHAPGHSPDHVVLFLASEAALFTGDAVLGRGTSVIDPPEGDLAAYLRSLRRMLELAPRTIYPGHGPTVFDAVGKLEEYLRHRAERERQLLEELSDGPRTIEALVAVVYSDYPPEVRPLAARSVLAHLMKLESEGRADHSGTGARATYVLSEPAQCWRCGRPVRGRQTLCGRCSLEVLQEQPEGS